MATMTKCDGGCGKVSPDRRDGLYIANHWVTVTIADPYGLCKRFKQVREYILCKDCIKRVDQALKEAEKGE